MAEFLNINASPKHVVPVHINVVLSGFQLDGHQGVSVSSDDLQQWLQHVQHSRPHYVIPSRSLDDETRPAQQTAAIEYEYHYHAIHLASNDTEALRVAICAQLREVEPNSSQFYVRASQITGLLSDFVRRLRLARSFTLFVLNIRDVVDEGKFYGYRFGFSQAELQMLRQIAINESGSETAPEALDVQKLAQHLVQTGSPAEQYFAHRAQEDAYMTEDCLTDVWTGPGRFAFVDINAGSATLPDHHLTRGPIVGGEGVHAGLRVQAQWLNDNTPAEVYAAPLTQTDSTDSAMAVNDVTRQLLQDMFNRMCLGEQEVHHSDICLTLKQQLKDLDGSTDSENALLGLLAGHDEGSQPLPHSRGWYMFASRLSALLLDTTHHLVTPSSSFLPSQFSERVNFHLYVVTNHNSFDPLGPTALNADVYREAISSLCTRQQQFSFAIHRVSMSDDAEISVAFHRSLRTAVIPQLRLDGSFVSAARMYIDGDELQHQLAQQTAAHEDADTQTHRHRDVFVFLFSVDVGMPLYVDKFYQARALHDMVIAVQSDYARVESHMQCNGNVVTVNLRDPLDQLVSATLTHLAGVLPPHLSYDLHRQRASQTWLWGMPHYQPTAMQMDAIHRNYVLAALQRSQHAYNDGVKTLQNIRTAPQTYANLVSVEQAVVFLQVTHAILVHDIWPTIIDAASAGEYDAALELHHVVMLASRRFNETARWIAAELSAAACVPVRQQFWSSYEWIIWHLLVCGVIAAMVSIYVLVKGFSRRKIKIN
eukprot:TRINITY_DN1720_c0_g1_i3.p1 TRINITY_DN1720_c0_g1~~TRINITY_DN1720_c0_g1_i3.p1  ORF type:complete len:764 (-),score=127.23 TRINITY_DN1720_c0_g1_i3:951-3242(-)